MPDLRPIWIPLGWFIAAALTSLGLLVLAAVGLVRDPSADEGAWVPLTIVVAFWLAGFVVGTRVGAAPILHGVGIGLFSLLVWLGVNVFLGEPTNQAAWRTLSREAAVGLLTLQTVAVVVGTRMGVRWVHPR